MGTEATVIPGVSTTGGMPVQEPVEGGTPNPVVPIQPPTTIDWTTFNVADLPEDVVKKTPAYRAVLTESIDRRKEIQELKSKQQGVATPASGGGTGGSEAANLAAQIAELRALREQDRVDAERTVLAVKYNVPQDRVRFISGDTPEERELAAAVLGEKQASGGGVSGSSSAGNPAGGTDGLGALRARLRARATDKGVESPSPFDPGVQVTRGGGAMRS